MSLCGTTDSVCVVCVATLRGCAEVPPVGMVGVRGCAEVPPAGMVGVLFQPEDLLVW